MQAVATSLMNPRQKQQERQNKAQVPFGVAFASLAEDSKMGGGKRVSRLAGAEEGVLL